MKVLYAIQGTGNGHLSRARHLIPILKKYCELDVLVSGTQSEIVLPYPIKFKYRGLSFLLNKKGGVHYGKTLWEAIAGKLTQEAILCPVRDYDLVINDFEPVSAWACKLKRVPCVALSHQASFLSGKTPRPRKIDLLGEGILRFYAPASKAIGFHFDKYDTFIETPVIRNSIRSLDPKDLGHYTVYLPALSDSRLLSYLQQIPDVSWEVFSRYTKSMYKEKNVKVFPIDNDVFIKSFKNCTGMLTGAGFETPAEALFLEKKLFTIPARRQYEQMCNAAALEKMGIPVMWKINSTIVDRLRYWIDHIPPKHTNFPEQSEEILLKLLEEYNFNKETFINNTSSDEQLTPSKMFSDRVEI